MLIGCIDGVQVGFMCAVCCKQFGDFDHMGLTESGARYPSMDRDGKVQQSKRQA
jgi:hypothetical protein